MYLHILCDSVSYKIREKLPVPRQSQPGEEKDMREKEDAESVIQRDPQSKVPPPRAQRRCTTFPRPLVTDRCTADDRRAKKKNLPSGLSLQYRVRMEYLRTQTLILSVWHHDTFGRNSFLGEVDVDLSKWDFEHAQLNDSALKPKVVREAPPMK